ncbi:hypothetical protein OA58_24025 [Microcystis aeruginosa NIES-88]|nr:hypothetical protein OA58_24025 [Microcystis aeruginosa NIES-88]
MIRLSDRQLLSLGREFLRLGESLDNNDRAFLASDGQDHNSLWHRQDDQKRNFLAQFHRDEISPLLAGLIADWNR